MIQLSNATQGAGLDSKDGIRSLHRKSVVEFKKQSQDFLRRSSKRFARYFASGDEILPDRIDPVLIEVKENWHKDLFRLARYYWSLPYSKGYGRRLNFLLMDVFHDKLIGIIGLQSPPISFAARDRQFSFPSKKGKELAVNSMMDAFTVGALPPYSDLLGGKLVALALTADEVRDAYRAKYGRAITRMESRSLGGDLVAITTVSAFGRSSIYNRLGFEGEKAAWFLGKTKGFGNFHLNGTIKEVRDWLARQGYEVKVGFGSGPRAIWNDITRACYLLDLDFKNILGHGIEREAYLFPLVNNLAACVEGRENPDYISRPLDAIVDYWHARWLAGRVRRISRWRNWRREDTLNTILDGAYDNT